MAWNDNTGPAGTMPPLPDDDLPPTRRARPNEAGLSCGLCGKRIYAGTLVSVAGYRRLWHAHCVSEVVATALDSSRVLGGAVASDGLRVAVTGGRNFTNTRLLNHCLALLADSYGIAVLGHGGARGADLLAGRWARVHHVPVRVYEADWHSLGPRAGPERNRRMLALFAPDLLVAFAGGTGTSDCLRAAQEKGITSWRTWAQKTPPPIPLRTGSSVIDPSSWWSSSPTPTGSTSRSPQPGSRPT
jgi:hypothetical protein